MGRAGEPLDAAAPGAARGPAQRRAPLPAPSFVACCARSGSTLLRWLIDAHPEISAPSETDLAVLASSVLHVAEQLDLGEEAASERARATVEGLMAAHLASGGKTRWCDKSLSNVFHLPLLARLWPEARFILLHRHAMDMVASGLEASPWGLSEYGFSQVAAMFPTKSVGALAAYWLDRTSRMLDFEAEHPDRCRRVRYEDLVTGTEELVGELFDFLGAARLDEAARAAFRADHAAGGPADYRIWYTDGVSAGAIGRGARIPPDQIVGQLRSGINECLTRLGYRTVDDCWGSGELDAATGVPPGTSELRIVDGNRVLLRRPLLAGAGPGVIAVERRIRHAVLDGSENLGAALRQRTVRLYGLRLRHFADERPVLAALVADLRAHEPEDDAALRAPLP